MIKYTQTIDEYIAQINPEHHEVVLKMRKLIKECVPDAVEQIAYRMPTYKLNGKVVCRQGTFRILSRSRRGRNVQV